MITEKALKIKSDLESRGLTVKYDDRDTHKPGWKFAEYELKGFPIRLALGPRDIENGTIELARRDTLEKQVLTLENIGSEVVKTLEDIQQNIYQKALNFRKENTYYANDWEEFRDIIENKGGFVYAHWDGTSETESKIKDKTKATIRCIPLDDDKENGKCIYSGKPSVRRVIFAKAY